MVFGVSFVIVSRSKDQRESRFIPIRVKGKGNLVSGQKSLERTRFAFRTIEDGRVGSQWM